MTADQLSKILQDLLCDAMDRWNARHELDPMQKLPWDRLDPNSKALYAERAAAFLDRYDVTPKSQGK